jgi:hypothetical protein
VADLARLILLLLAVAFLASVSRGKGKAWLRAKFTGKVDTGARR